MRYPRFIAEIGLASNRPKLRVAVWSGYALAIAFEALALAGQLTGVLPFTWSLHVLVTIKLVTNTLAWLSLRLDRAVLEAAGLNAVADIAVMTAAMYYTGGQASPLFAIYIIEISVFALLSNRGATFLILAVIMGAFSAMAVAIHRGVLVQYPSPMGPVDLSTRHVVMHLLFAGLVLGLPTFYTSAIVRLLRAKEEALEARTRALMEAGEQRSRFMAHVTHELRTPLHGIGAVTELLESEVYGPLTERQRRAMGEIAQSAEGLEKLVDDLLLLAKADAGKLEPRLAPVNVDEVVQGVVAGLRWMADLKEHEVEVLPLGGDPLPIRSDRAQLAQILVNLVSNAIKFTPPRGRISVAARRHEEGVEIAVSDTGIGIADEELETIFDEFHQVDGTDERKHGGIGLGLALVKRLAASLGASIEVTSRYGEGSTFRIRLPMAPPAEEAEAEKTEAL